MISQDINHFLVWCPDRGQDVHTARVFSAMDEEDAATKWAALDDWSSAEYTLASGGEAVVCVVRQNRPTSTAKRFRVTGRSEPVYTATEERGAP